MKKVKFLMEILNTIKWLDLVSYNFKMDKNMKVNGKIIKRMVTDNTNGLMVVSILVIIKKAKETGRVK